MLSKELEILKQIEELYSGDVSEEKFAELCKGKETKLLAWKESFKDYELYDISSAINYYYDKKSSKTRPSIAQLKAILQERGAKVIRQTPQEKAEPSFGLKFQQEDKLKGEMKWFVPDYLEVERLILREHWGWVYNIKNPTSDEFHRCLEEWCEERTGKRFRFLSDNEINQMSEREKSELYEECHNIITNFKPRRMI